MLQKVHHDRDRIGAETEKRAEAGNGAAGIAANGRLKEFDRLTPVGQTEHVAHSRCSDGRPGFGLNHGLVQQRLGIAN